MSLLSASTLLSSLSPLLTYSPCITCNWENGWTQGWNNTGNWTGTSVRYAEGWAVTNELAVETEFQGSSFSLIIAPTSAYNLTLSINGTVRRTLPDLGTSHLVNVTDLPSGTHSFKAAFNSIDITRVSNPDQRVRFYGLELGWEGVSVNSTTIDDSLWASGEPVSYSAGWDHLSSTDLTKSVLDTAEAAIFTPLLPSFSNSSVSWTSDNGSSVTTTFTGNYLTVQLPLYPAVGSFIPTLDSVAYPAVNLSKNLPDPSRDSSLTYGEVGWHIAGLADGEHTFTMTNVGTGVMVMDGWVSGSVSQTKLSTTLTSSSAASASATSSAAAATVITAASTSTSLGIFIAVGVGGLALLGLAILLVYKIAQRRRAASNSSPLQSGASFSTGGKASFAAGGLRSKISPPRPFSSSNPSPFTSANSAPFQALAPSSTNPSSRNLLAPSRTALADPKWASTSSSRPQMAAANPSMVSFSSAVPVARSTAAPTGILMRPMSEAGEIGDDFQQADGPSFSSLAPPSQPQIVHPVDQDDRSTSFSSLDSVDRQQWEREESARARDTVRTSGSVYPDQEEGRDSTYSMSESYFGLDASMASPMGTSERSVTPVERRARPGDASKGYF